MQQDARRIEISGIVQGVGFRPWVYRLARRTGLAGTVWNGSSGVTIDVFGDSGLIDRFIRGLHDEAPAASRIDTLVEHPIPYLSVEDFTIAPSVESADRVVSIPPDLATCPECLAETLDPANRRYRYPFTNCTNCGPRFSIVRDVPYDRPNTTMQSFPLCPSCQAEYESPSDRRFHAEPNACAVCGPRLSALSYDGTRMNVDDPIRFVVRALNAQMIVAVKGVGGFHLACDATSESAVRRLRERKRRSAKPFAIMVRDLAAAEAVALLNDEERALLSSVERPIVLARRKPDSRLAASVAPGNDLVGLMLPYSPLHHLLLAEIGKPVVMTSGNRSEEPMVSDIHEAIHSLRGIADIFLTHDREIESRVDDSVARVVAGRPVLFRRSRGYVPRTMPLPRAVSETILACGAHLKNTFALASGDRVFMGPHIGDLETVEIFRTYAESIERAKRFMGWTPTVVVHDLHPEYQSTRYALAQQGVKTIAVQHHHAHIAGVMAEHRLTGTVAGIAWDGVGYGTDGAAWGGEFMLVTADGFERVATFRPLRLAGGDVAVRETWRIAVAALRDIGEEGSDLPLFAPRTADVIPTSDAPTPERRALIEQMLDRNFNSPAAHGVGRWFDAFSSIFLGNPESRYEGEAAIAWNNVADGTETSWYSFDIDDTTSPAQVDLRPVLRAAIADCRNGIAIATISGRFHNTLARIVAVMVGRMADAAMPVALSGGCFQSSLLTEKVMELLGSDRVFFNQQVPPGDGGIALGQVYVADALLRTGARMSIDRSAAPQQNESGSRERDAASAINPSPTHGGL